MKLIQKRVIVRDETDVAELCRREMVEAGIKVGDIFLDDEYYYVPWMPISKAEYDIGVRIVCEHIY